MDASAKNSNDEFVMKESKIAHLVICSFFFILFGVSLFNLLENEGIRNNYAEQKFLFALIIVSLVSGCINLLHIVKQKTILTINDTGIYSMGELKTNWKNFINARSIEQQRSNSYSVRFFVLIQYYKDDKVYESEIQILETFDRSSEEVIDAIKKFNKYPVVES